MNRVTLDTNVIVSGLNFPRGKPARILAMAAEGLIEVAVSDAILAEVHEVLQRRFKWSPEAAREALSTIRSLSTHVTPTEKIDAVSRDVDDNAILECAVAGGSEVIISGDGDLLSLGSFRGIKIQRPSDYLSESRVR